ncbi:MAG: Holliday junction resolvase RuvX [Dehalococcoidia bacterium]|nr:Holliday junction resolvase RuvX [Dehalococcoidia bacterium]
MINLGLDVGERRIGVAVSDPDELIATPVTVIEGKSVFDAIASIIAVADEYGAQRLVVGLPISLSGEMGAQAESVLAFIAEIRKKTELPVATWDERLSTVAAERLLSSAELEGGRRSKSPRPTSKRSRQDAADRKGRRDAMAAAFILQGYLDRRRADSYADRTGD